MGYYNIIGGIGLVAECDLPKVETRVRFSYPAPKQNSTAFWKPEGGTREARPTDFPPFFQMNSEFLARWRALIFRRGRSAMRNVGGIPIRQILFSPIRIHIWDYTSILRISAIVDKLLISIWLKYPEH